MSNEPSTSDKEPCAVCGAPASGKRYGAVSCLGCIVFFRRTALRNMQYRCQRDGNCEVTVETRCVCRHCRMQKCLAVGMNPDAIQIRDVIGPRRPGSSGSSVRRMSSRSTPDFPVSPSPPVASPEVDSLEKFLELQKAQWAEHKTDEKFSQDCVFMKNDYHRRATPIDINLSLRTAIQNSKDFVELLETPLSLTEYSIGYMLIDQAHKTISQADDGFWLLQNGAFLGLHPDFKFEGAGNEEKEKSHFDYVTMLLESIGKPFRDLEVDEAECVILKVLLASNQNPIRNQSIRSLISRKGPERLGELILLISSIRCAIKSFYNLTRVSDLFDFRLFDQVVRDVLVE